MKNTATGSVHYWTFATLQNRVALMHDLYQRTLSGDHVAPTSVASLEEDPFYDPPTLQVGVLAASSGCVLRNRLVATG